MSEFFKEIKKTKPVKVLTYERAYGLLIDFINTNYWRLEAYAESKMHSDTLPIYRAVPRGNIFPKSGSAGERRLNKFLNEIATGGADDPTCAALLDLITKKLKYMEGFNFPRCLAKVILEGVLDEVITPEEGAFRQAAHVLHVTDRDI